MGQFAAWWPTVTEVRYGFNTAEFLKQREMCVDVCGGEAMLYSNRWQDMVTVMIYVHETDAMDGRSGQKDNLLVFWSNEIGYAN